MKLHPDVTHKTTLKSFGTLEQKFRETHGDKYDYSLVEYKGAHKKIDIICSIHGIFSQTPDNHLTGCGCSLCYGKKKKTTEGFILEAKEMHGDKYDYSEVIYKNNKTKVNIICYTHGVFEQTPSHHVNMKQGCPTCSRLKQAKNHTKTTDEFIREAILIHGNKYDYSDTKYTKCDIKLHISCYKHGVFKQSPFDHLNGNGCKLCAKERTNYDKYKNQRTMLYYIRINDFYKIGLTKASVESRFKKEIDNNVKIEILKTIEFEDGWEAYKLEQKILKETRHLSIQKEESPIKGGWTEVRKSDISEFLSNERR